VNFYQDKLVETTAKTRVRSQEIYCGIFYGQGCTVTGFSPCKIRRFFTPPLSFQQRYLLHIL